jgi:hypothetical protein
MLFGQAGTAKANNLANVVSQVSANLPALRSGIDVYGIGTGRAGLTGGAAQQRFGQGYYTPGSEAFTTGVDAANKAHQLELQRQQLQNDNPSSLQNLLTGSQIFSTFAGGIGSLAKNAYGGGYGGGSF